MAHNAQGETRTGWGKTIARWVATVVLLAVVGVLIGREVRRHWQELSQYEFSLSWPMVAMACVAGAGFYFFNAMAWRFAVRRHGQTVSIAQSYRLYALSLFGRYVPGKALLAIVRMELGARLGISRAATAVAVLYENGLLLATGAMLSVVVGMGLFFEGGRSMVISALVAAGVCATALAPPVFYRVINLAFRVAGKQPFAKRDQLRFADLGRMALFFVGVWACGGGSLYLLGVGLDASLADRPVELALIFVVSQILGFVALFAPGGLGVREVVMIGLLKQVTTPEQAILLPILSRLVMVSVEITQAAILQACLRSRGPSPSDASAADSA